MNLNKNIITLSSDHKVGTGCLPPMPDLRDYTQDQQEIKALIKKLGINKGKKAAESVDLRKWCRRLKIRVSLVLVLLRLE